MKALPTSSCRGSVRRSALKPLSLLIALLLCIAAVLSGCNGTSGPETTETSACNATQEPLAGTETFTLSESAKAYSELLTLLGLPCAVENGGRELRVALDPALPEEGYKLDIGQTAVSITASGETGVFRALAKLSRLLATDGLSAANLSEFPDVCFRGVIEGFYGTAWSHEFRLDLLKFMGQTGLNTFIYAPKDDAKLRSQWRKLYTEKELEKLSRLADTAAKYKVKFVYAISPGLDIDLGSGYQADREILFEKCESMYAIGIRNFAILLDDIPTLNAEGHARLLNDFQTLFAETHEGTEDLIAITPEFCQAMVTSYTDSLAPLLNEKITMMWTGNGVLSETVSPRDLKSINEKLGRKVLIWWNYPVNDTMSDRMFLGPCEGLSADLDGSISGLVSNPMNQGYASLAPLYTVAEYLWDTDGYDPDASLRRAAQFLYPECAQEFLVFADIMRASLINGDRSAFALSADINAYLDGSTDAALIERLEQQMQAVSGALKTLKEKAGAEFIGEAGRFIAKAMAYADNAGALFGLEKLALNDAGTSGEGRKAALALYDTLSASRLTARSYGTVVSPDVLSRIYEISRPRSDELLARFGIELTFVPEPITNCNAYQDFSVDNILDGDDSTYFWTSGALSCDPDDPGYIGVDLGHVTEISRIFITTGLNGRDALITSVVEYSEDGDNWIGLASGKLGDRIVLEPEGILGRYVRIRGGNSSETNWVIVRSFEVNSEADPVASMSRISTNLPVYQDHSVENVLDESDDVFFWSAGAPSAGSQILLTLDEPAKFSRVVLKMGDPEHPSDIFRSGAIEYSCDGASWTQLCELSGAEIDVSADFEAKYVRVICSAGQTNWVIVRYFGVS